MPFLLTCCSQVVFLNNASFPCSMHAHGVRYDKGSEGTAYDDGSGPANKQDDAVQPGHSYTYTWQVGGGMEG